MMGSGSSFQRTWTQFFPPKPAFTEKNIPSDLSGKVYFVSGANSGLGEEISRILYTKNAKVYVACRSEKKADETIARLKAAAPASKGELVFFHLDLADLEQVRSAAQKFLASESKLNVLFNNAGVMVGNAQPSPVTTQGHELALGVNCIGTFLLTKLVTPILAKTAQVEPTGTVRTVWLSSYGLEEFAPKGRGIDMHNLDYHIPKPGIARYGISKGGDWLLGVEYGRRHRSDGILSVPINPGNLRTALARDQGTALRLAGYLLSYPPINGAYTQLFAAFSPEVTTAKADWIIPWGRFAPLRPDLPQATKSEDEGGNGNAEKFWEWCEAAVKDYL